MFSGKKMMKLVVLFSFGVLATVRCSSMSANFPECRLQCGDDEEQAVSSDSSGIADLQNEIAEIKSLLTDKFSRTEEIINRNRLTLCDAGMQDFTIKDNQITASSYYPSNHLGDYEPRRGRLFSSGGGGHWAAQTNTANEWIQVDLGRNEQIFGVVTQGTYLDHHQYVTSYNVLYRAENSESLTPIVDGTGNPVVFRGNTDDDTPVINNFSQPITARYFRINVLTWNRHICMRFAVLLC